MGILDDLEARDPVTKTVAIYMDTAAVSEVMALRDEVQRVRANELPGLKSEAAVHQRRLEEAEARMLESEREFRFKALSDAEYDHLLNQHKSDDEKLLYDPETFPAALIATASFEPVLTEAEAHRVRGLVSSYEWDALFGTAFKVQVEKPRPFTGPGTDRIPGSGLSSITASTKV